MSGIEGIVAREREIDEIYKYINYKIESRKSGILYLTGPPGTGKSMSVSHVLDTIKNVPKLNINCLKSQTSKGILTKICEMAKVKLPIKYNETEISTRLGKKFTGRTCETHIIVLDEIDQVPKSKNLDLVKTIFTWTNQTSSKLILIGIANTVTLTSRYQSITSIFGLESQTHKIIFKPYTSKDIRAILLWYLENDENFEDAEVDPKALDMISAKFAKDNGDIRAALNALKSTVDDTVKNTNLKPLEETYLNDKNAKSHDLDKFPTPPPTPPPPTTPRRERTNLISVTTSVKKRLRSTHYLDDAFPFPHQIILTCIFKMCSQVKDFTVDMNSCMRLMKIVLCKYNLSSTSDDCRAILDSLILQGQIAVKKGRPREKIVLKASENELDQLITRKDMLMDLINTLV